MVPSLSFRISFASAFVPTAETSKQASLRNPADDSLGSRWSPGLGAASSSDRERHLDAQSEITYPFCAFFGFSAAWWGEF